MIFYLENSMFISYVRFLMILINVVNISLFLMITCFKLQ